MRVWLAVSNIIGEPEAVPRSGVLFNLFTLWYVGLLSGHLFLVYNKRVSSRSFVFSVLVGRFFSF